MSKRLLELAERVLSAILSGLGCLGLFILIWALLKVFGSEDPKIENAGIIIFISMLAVRLINDGLKDVRSLLWEEHLDELIKEGSKTDEDIQADELYEHLEVK